MNLEDWLDDLCVRFIINLPPEELESVERICFQVEEAQWFYEDFVRPLDPSLPSLPLRNFSLRIFQHCPLFSEWSTDNHTAAFAEFLAYKSRVPVRGAIMLNADMDRVILVKGWKKGANWSFPRGKINKDEDDLDCAIREVYEETGLDLRAAGLIKAPKEMKHIEVTMREQHMRLYVFRGVPMDAHLEPRTRKEISKIEWYKLDDLPTLAKNQQQEGMKERLASTNKFYMVAPFLVPLKKWIAQQRKREYGTSFHTRGLTSTLPEESPTDHEACLTNGVQHPENLPSDLPEVSQTQGPSIDASLHLKQILNIDRPADTDQESSNPPAQVDAIKSSALLALLRKGSCPDVQTGSNPKTPYHESFLPSDEPESPHSRHVRQPPQSTLPPPPQFPTSLLDKRPSPGMRLISPALEVVSSIHPNAASRQGPAPYQRTGDPDFSQAKFKSSQGPRVPPASALPPLTNHAQALLDVFKHGTSEPRHEGVARVSPTHAPAPVPLHTAAPAGSGHASHTTIPGPLTATPSATDLSSLLPTLLANRASGQETAPTKVAAMDHRANLLGLFTGSQPAQVETVAAGLTTRPPLPPVELAASAVQDLDQSEPSQKHNPTKPVAQNAAQPTMYLKQARTLPRAGRTSATIQGPLNQPQFDGFVRSPGRSSLANGSARTPVPQHRTLFDPSQGMQKKILARAPGADRSPAISPRPRKANSGASPRRSASRKDGEVKAFQPQILRRPPLDANEPPGKSNLVPVTEASRKDGILRESLTSQSLAHQASSNPYNPQAESHRQALLSLFGEPMRSAPVTTTQHSPAVAARRQTPVSPPPPPRSGSGMVSPLAERPAMASKSRCDSLASVVSAGSEARSLVMQRRQTAASDKAFLMGYLGRIAGQEA